MKKKTFSALLAVIVLGLLCSFFVSADHAVYLNNSSTKLNGRFSENYAVGGDGVQKIGNDEISVLTASGISTLRSRSDAEPEGGGGLLYTDGSIRIKSDIIKVGLSFNFNRGDMDTTVQSAQLDNSSGGGFAFGYYNDAREFVELDETDIDTIYIYAAEPEELRLGVYDDEGTLLYETTYPNTKENFIAIHPRSSSGKALTRYNVNRYLGDFEVGYTAGEGFTVINTLPLEDYIKGVIAAEMVSNAPIEAYKAQAVASRTYAQRWIKNTDLYEYYGFDLTNNTYYQAYYGYFTPSGTDYQTVNDAVEQTRNEYLTYNGSLIDALYTAANGGETVDGGYPYLKSFADPYEGDAWTRGLFGHGCGMSQWGAYAMAKYHEFDYQDILGFYYTKVGISYGYES